MATTTNYSWTTPDDTALVKDGAAAIRTLGSAIDTTTKALNPSTTLGDIEYRSSTANTNTRLGIGTTGQVLTVSGGVPAWSTPSQGLTFTQRLSATGATFNTIAYNGSNLYIAAGNAGVLYTSTDGLTWTSRTSGFGANNIQEVFFGNGLWVAVGTNNIITTSTDGITWTARTSPYAASANINGVIYANSLWVAVATGGGSSNTGGIAYSSDGITWTRKSQTLTVGVSYNCVVWNGTNWIVGADLSTNNYLYASTPSGTWIAGSTGSGDNINQIYWDGTRHITAEGSSIRYSTSNTLGTTSIYQDIGITTLNAGKKQSWYYNGNIYLAGLYLRAYTPTSVADITPLNVNIISPASVTAPALTNKHQKLWYGAAGYIIADTVGRLFTSF